MGVPLHRCPGNCGPWHVVVPVLGVESELQLQAYATATATLYLSRIGNLHHCLWQCQILNPLSKARDQTHILMDTSQILNLLSHNGNSRGCVFSMKLLTLPCNIVYTAVSLLRLSRTYAVFLEPRTVPGTWQFGDKCL